MKDKINDNTSPSPGAFEYSRFVASLAVFSAALQFAVHAWWQFQSGNPFQIGPRLVSWLHDCAIIFVLYLAGPLCANMLLKKRPSECAQDARPSDGAPEPVCANMLLKKLPSECAQDARPSDGARKNGRATTRLRASLLAAHALLWFASSCLLLLYPRHIPDFLNFPVNIFAVDAGAASAFATQFLAPGEAVTAVLMTIALFIVSIFKAPPAILARPNIYIKAVFLIASVVTLAAPSPNPFIFSVQDSLVSGLSGGGRQFPLLVRPNSMPASMNSADNLPGSSTQEVVSSGEFASTPFGDCPAPAKIAHVVVIVMETVEGRRFTGEVLENKKTFIGSRRSEFRYFSKYFTTNLDSYTSLVAMISSVFVPFPAYSDAEMYSGVRNAPNLVASFKKAGAACMYVSTAQNQPFIPSRGDWNRIVTRSDIPADSSMAYIDSPPIESAVEDRAARPVILDFMRKNPRSFILHECVFGHTQQWLDLTRKSQLEYYDQYVRELTEGITALGLRGETLLILVSDHGSRQDPAEFENYLVPLIMWGPGVRTGDDNRFLSHLDFSGLVREAFSGKPWPASDKPILTVGHSGKWVYGQIGPDGAYQFLDNSRGRVLGHGGAADPLKLNEIFQRYLNGFVRRFPDRRTLK